MRCRTCRWRRSRSCACCPTSRVDGRASLQTILLGQPQFRPILASKDVEQLRQRVLASYHLGPMTEAETRLYVEHRLRTVNWNGDPAWNADAFTALHRQTGGIPRRINTLCSRVLLFGALEEAHTITGDMVEATAEELNRDLGAGLEASVASPFTPSQTDKQEDILRRIELLERNTSRQDQAVRRVMHLLEANVTGQS